MSLSLIFMSRHFCFLLTFYTFVINSCRYLSYWNQEKQCSRSWVMNLKNAWFREFKMLLNAIFIVAAVVIQCFLYFIGVATGYTRSKWRNGRRRSKNWGCLMPQMRRQVVFCTMLDTCSKTLTLTLEGNSKEEPM